MIIYRKHANECKRNENPNKCARKLYFSVQLRGSDTTPELAEPYFYYGQALLYLGLSEQQVFGNDIVKGD